jgi:hypothetical protein
MMRFSPAICFAMLVLPSVLRGLDFAPREVETEIEAGIVNKELQFQDGKRRVLYQFPAGWRVSPRAGAVMLTPPSVSQAELIIDGEAIRDPRPVDAREISACREWVAASLPRESTAVEFEAELVDGVAVHGCRTVELTVGFGYGNQSLRKCVWFVYADKTVIRFTVSARERDFARVKEAVRGSLYSWRWLEN